MSGLTKRQRREVETAVRHIGRAMKALHRAKIPLDSGYTPWLYSLNKGEQRLAQASDCLIDGLDAESGESSRCVKCGGPNPFHDPACVVHPESADLEPALAEGES